MMKDFLLSYDTMALRPRHGILPSRTLGDTSLIFLGRKFKLPIVPANMKDVIDEHIAKYLSENDYFYIYHRNGEYGTNYKPTHSFVAIANQEAWKLISISVGVSQKHFAELTDIYNDGKGHYRIDFITIDIAHGDHDNIKKMISFIREKFPKSKLIAGNVATDDGLEYLMMLGVDAVKVGIGGGSICTTRYMTGFHLPTAHSVWECDQFLRLKGKDFPLIADGGAKHFGDTAKALTLGATMVMAGGWFASCIDSPAQIEDGKKIYRGSTSYELKGHKRHVEGRRLELEQGTTYQQRLQELQDALTSSISYAGGTDLSAFDNVRWDRVMPYH